MMVNEFNYTLVRKSRLKYLRIKVPKDGSIIVTVNMTCSKKEISRFLESKKDWIEKAINRKREKRESIEALRAGKKGHLLHVGQWYRVEPQLGVINDGEVSINENEKTIAVPVNNRVSLQESVNEWQRESARRVAGELVERFSVRVGVNCNRVFIRSQKSRWGCCSTKGNLSINWRLIRAPSDMFEYVIAHELCHIRELSHSRKFWALVASLYPGYKQARKWFNDNGETLYLDIV